MLKMHQIVRTIHNTISSLGLFLVGLLAAMASAFVEYLVLQQWLEIPEAAAIIGKSGVWAFTLALVLEMSKLFLTFYSHALATVENQKKWGRTKRAVNALIVLLCLFSALCTTIFCTNAFGGDTLVVEEAAKNTLTVIEQTRSDTFAVADKAFFENVEREVKPSLLAMQNAKEALESYNGVSNWYQMEGQKAAKVTYDQTVKDYEDDYRAAVEKFQGKKDEAYEAAQVQYDAQMAELQNGGNFEVASAGDNKFLKTFLLFCTRNIFQMQSYSRAVYFSWVMVIALFISAVLESVINISQRLMVATSDEMKELIRPESGLSKAATKFVNRVAGFLAIVLVSVCAMIAAGLVLLVEFTAQSIVLACVAYVITAWLGLRMERTLPVNLLGEEDEESGAAPIPVKPVKKSYWLNKGIEVFQEWGLTLAFNFTVYLLLGLLMGNDISTLGVTAFAVAIGAWLARALNVRQFFFAPVST